MEDAAGERGAPEPEEERSVLQGWVELPDGRLELLELPLTPELYLDPELDDKMLQGGWHSHTCMEIFGLLVHHFRHQPDTLVVHDMKHLFGRGRSAPSPDISVVRGLCVDYKDLQSYNAVKHGVPPSLVIEVVSPMSARIRHTNLTDKVKLYERVGIREYVIVDSPRNRRGGRCYTLLGYRLDAATGRYQPISLDSQGRLLSETTGIWLQIDPTGDRVLLFDAATGCRLLNLDEQGERVDAAEKRAEAAEERAEAAKEEAARLRAEIERLRGSR